MGKPPAFLAALTAEVPVVEDGEPVLSHEQRLNKLKALLEIFREYEDTIGDAHLPKVTALLDRASHPQFPFERATPDAPALLPPTAGADNVPEETPEEPAKEPTPPRQAGDHGNGRGIPRVLRFW